MILRMQDLEQDTKYLPNLTQDDKIMAAKILPKLDVALNLSWTCSRSILPKMPILI